MMSIEKISEALDLIELVEFTVISAINEADSLKNLSNSDLSSNSVSHSARAMSKFPPPKDLPLGGMYRSLDTARKLLRDFIAQQVSDAKHVGDAKGNISEVFASDDSASADEFPINQGDVRGRSSVIDSGVERPLRQEINERSSVYSRTTSKTEAESLEAPGRKAGGLAARIRPVPDEVRGRVRELVDMLEEEDLNNEQFKETRA